MLENTGSIGIIVLLVSLVISITLHEATHAYAGLWLGDDTAQEHGRISLNPLKHVDPFSTILLPILTLLLFGVPLLAAKPVPFNPDRVRYEEFGAALVGLAGPFANALLALVGAGIYHLLVGSISVLALDSILLFIEVNIALFVFNMIPIPPLDGSRALYAIAPEPVQETLAALEQAGIFIIFALVLAVPAFSELLIYLNHSLFRLII